jgi:hypothetical protein
MAVSGRQLDLRLPADRAEMNELLITEGIAVSQDAIEFISSRLSEQWLTLWASQLFNIRTTDKGTVAVHLKDWAELVRGMFHMRGVRGIDGQFRRLNIQSHEALDTSLVIRVAARYVQRGFVVDFRAER